LSRIWSADSAHEFQTVGIAAYNAPPPGAFRSLFGEGVVAPPRRDKVAPAASADPIEQAHADGFAMGFDEGVRLATEAVEADKIALERLTQALEQLAPASSGTLATMLQAAVLRLVEQIAGEVDVDAALLQSRCEAVAAFVEEGEGQSALRLHPDDMTLVESTEVGVPLVADDSMPRGCVKLETTDGWIEDGPDVRLSRLRALMDDMEGKL
jgi:flagellar assembly protein FliH